MNSKEDSVRITPAIIKEAIVNCEKSKENDVEIIDYQTESGSEVGDNFTCTMFRILVQALVKKEPKQYDFIAKVMPIMEMRAMMLRDSKIFDTEVFFYKTLAPKFKEYAQKSQKIKLSVADCYYASTSSGVIILENLKNQNFKMVDKKLGLDEDHLLMTLKGLAHFHSLTYHYLQIENTEILKDLGIYRVGWMNANIMDNVFRDIFSNLIILSKEILEKNDYLESAKKMECLIEKGAVQKAMDKHIPLDPSALNVILHGDCWSNNFLFSYKNNETVSEIRLVDMQLMRVNRPCVDIVHVLYSCTDPIVREQKWKDWLKFYYDTFVTSLSELGYDGPTLYTMKQCEDDFQRARTFGFLLGLLMCQGVLTDETKKGGTMDMSKFFEEADPDMMTNLWIKAMKDTISKHPAIANRMIQLVLEAERYDLI